MDRIFEMILVLCLTMTSLYSLKLSHESNSVMQKIHDQVMIIKG